MANSQHIQEALKKIWGQFPMLNFSRRTPTLGWFFPPDSEKVLKIAHFCVFRHIGGVEWVRKNVDLKIQWVKGNCSKNCGYWASWGPTIIFSEKKSPYLNNLSPIPVFKLDIDELNESESSVLLEGVLPLLRRKLISLVESRTWSMS